MIYIDHISFLVSDLDQAEADWRDILSVLSPEHLETVTYGSGKDGDDGVPMKWCTFQNPDPHGVSIQLWAAMEPGTWVDKVIAKRGEYVHHICFLSDNFDKMQDDLRAKGVPLLLEEPSHPDTQPWLRWNFIPKEKSHGALLELATRYLVAGDAWVPHPGNAENDEYAAELRRRFAP